MRVTIPRKADMIRSCLAAMMALAGMTGVALAQAPPQDSAHTLFVPNAPDPGRSGQIVQLPQGGMGVTTGGTANYQTLGTPGGSAVMVPNGGGSADVIGSGGGSGIVHSPR